MQISQMQSISSTSIVERYLAFFTGRGHLELPGSPLVVAGSTTSFTIAGMQPLLPYPVSYTHLTLPTNREV